LFASGTGAGWVVPVEEFLFSQLLIWMLYETSWGGAARRDGGRRRIAQALEQIVRRAVFLNDHDDVLKIRDLGARHKSRRPKPGTSS